MFDFGITEIGIASLVGAAWWLGKGGEKKGELTPERKAIYEAALTHCKDPDKLRTLAKVFEEQGLKEHAVMLRKRATLRELPNEVREARKATFKRAMASTNPDAVEQVANAFAGEGATGAADALRQYAASLRTIK